MKIFLIIREWYAEAWDAEDMNLGCISCESATLLLDMHDNSPKFERGY